MTAIHRREMLRVILGGAGVAAAGLALMPGPAESAPLMMSKSLPAVENLVDEAVVVVRRRRRRVCWWRRGQHLPLALSLKDRRERLYGPRSAINGTFHSGWRDILASREQKGHSLIASERDLHEAAVDKTPVFSEPHRRAERLVKRTIFASRWLLAPFYLGLAICLIVLLIKFVQKLVKLVTDTLFSGGNDMIPVVLSLIDLSLIANLLLIVMFSGYENFVSRFELDDQKYKPAWIGHIDFGELKLKLLTSIVAISAVHLLESFMNIDRRPMRPRLQLAPRPDQARVSRHQGGVVALMGVSTALAGMPSSILAIR